MDQMKRSEQGNVSTVNLTGLVYRYNLSLVFADAGISNYIAQTEKFGTGVSDGPIYSTIDPTSDDMRTFNGAFSQQTTPYATTPVVPYGGQNLHSPESEDNAWNVQAGTSGILYAQPDRSKAEIGTYMGVLESY